MTDISLEQFEQLFDKKLSKFQEHVDTRFGEADRRTDERINALVKRMDEGFAKAATIDQIDAIANHLQKFSHESGSRLDEQGKTLERIERRLNADLDRLDDHGKRIEKLEAAAGLPSPPRGS